MKYNQLLMTTILLFILAGCNAEQDMNREDSTNQELKIAAASGLIFAFREVAEAFEQEFDVTITLSFGSTGQLADQISNGAPFDLFAAADVASIDMLSEQGAVIPTSQTLYATGSIGVTTRADQPIEIDELSDLTDPDIKKIAIANPAHAPYGLAAKQALESADLWRDLEKKLIFTRNISSALDFLESGNVEAAILAKSITRQHEAKVVFIDEQLHDPIHQAIAVVTTSDEHTLATQFIDFLITDSKSREIMTQHGFSLPKLEGQEND